MLNERVPGAEALTAVWVSHRVSAGGKAARSPIMVAQRRTRGRIHF